MKTFDGTASYLETHKKAIQLPGSPAPDLWKCKTVSCEDGAGIDWCHHHSYLIQMNTGKPLAQAAKAAIKHCKKVEDTTLDWNGFHDLGLMWG
ncbi:hypothetical protein E2P81_ATG00844 [Venturia nashicola]|nr:hypothetical protein E2P81_ATG00844 [Venturia nashicola]